MRRRLTAFCLVTLLAVSGCTDADDDGPDTAPTGSTTGSEAPATPEPSPSGVVDACSLLEPAEYSTWASENDTGQRHLRPGDASMAMCTIPSDDARAFAISYGYAMEPSSTSFDQAARRFESGDYGSDEVQRLDLADGEGYWAEVVTLPTEPVAQRGYARRGDFYVEVQWSGYEVSPETTSEVLTAMLDRSSPAWLEHPIDLVDSCPPADDARLAPLISDISHVRSSEAEDHVICSYGGQLAGAGAGLIEIAASSSTPDEAADQLRFVTALSESGDEYGTEQVGEAATLVWSYDTFGDEVWVVSEAGGSLRLVTRLDTARDGASRLYGGELPRQALDDLAIGVAGPILQLR